MRVAAIYLNVCPAHPPPGRITLRDLKRCKLSHIFFDTFFNIEKYLDHEQKDPFSVIRVSWVGTTRGSRRSVGRPGRISCPGWFCVLQEVESDGQDVTDWERYATEEYDILVAEEAANEQCDDM